MSKRDPLFPVYKRLKDRIESDTVGAEITDGLAEICYNILIYWVKYSLTREFNTVYYDYDTEPDNRSKTFISIINGEVFDSQGNQVTNDFDFTAVEDYFDFDDTFPDD